MKKALNELLIRIQGSLVESVMLSGQQ